MSTLITYRAWLVFLLCSLLSCQKKQEHKEPIYQEVSHQIPEKSKRQILDSLFSIHKEYVSTAFDFPIGKPDSKGYYNAQKFRENDHLGEDWNGIGGGNSDLGAPIYSISNGYVYSSQNIGGGWGNVIRIIHSYKNTYYESIYAHCDTILIKENQFIKRGQKIGTIGTADGTYLAHLHLEIRDSIFMSIGAGYASDSKGYVNPTDFIKTH